MKFSYLWLSELVPGLSTDPAELQHLITMKTAECEGVEAVGAHFTRIVAARVLSVESLPKGKNKGVVIDLGEGRQAVVVCGAPNIKLHDRVPLAQVGAKVGALTIQPKKSMGVLSEGMLCSPRELGISDRTLRKAKQELGIKSKRKLNAKGRPEWFWHPQTPTQPPKHTSASNPIASRASDDIREASEREYLDLCEKARRFADDQHP